jgi:hypothetical protein
MARWICNAVLPGSFLQGRGIIKTGQEFETPDDPDDPLFERARESWLPQDAAAEKLVAQAKKDADKMVDESAKAAARRRQAEEDAKNGVLTRTFETKKDSIAQQFGANPASAFAQGDAEIKRNEAWTKIVRKQSKKDDSEEKQAVQEAVREHIALANAAAAQPVPDPGDLTAGKDAPKGKK